jgi:ribonuclease BN (tRNA processing enzyme)
LNHPGGCLGYRFECQGRSFVFCSDHEQTTAPDPTLIQFARGADLLYVDGQYLKSEYTGQTGVMGEAPMARRGWGHSTVEDCVTSALAAGVKQLHLGHREPKRDDADLARVEKYMRQCLTAGANACQACIPFEGMSVEI